MALAWQAVSNSAMNSEPPSTWMPGAGKGKAVGGLLRNWGAGGPAALARLAPAQRRRFDGAARHQAAQDAADRAVRDGEALVAQQRPELGLAPHGKAPAQLLDLPHQGRG